MTLPIATEGCCTGHPCDSCKTCQSGRCCRRDNPDYKLPELGEWDGPIYGELGVLNDDGERLECHACGEWFAGLNHHAWAAHDLLAREYKATFGLNMNTALVSAAVSTRLRKNGEYLRDNYHKGGVNIKMTPEQHSGYSARPRSKQFSLQLRERQVGKTKRSQNKTGFIGVRAEGRLWVAQAGPRSIKRYLGLFDTPEAAARAYDAKARELYGDTARLNFPEE